MIDDYFQTRGEAGYSAKRVFTPQLSFREEEFSLVADTARRTYVLYDVKDVVAARGKISGAKSNFKGLIGERILTAVLEEFTAQIVRETAHECPGLAAVGNVLREEKEYLGKGYAVTYNNRYLLRYKSETTFFVLTKRPFDDPDSWYQQERLGLTASEIDGLAYVHVGDAKHLIVGESKTINSWDNIKNSRFHDHVTEVLFPPFRSLFPRHRLVFLFLGRGNILFDDRGSLKPYPSRLAEELDRKKVSTVFVPFPETPKSLDEHAEDMYRMLPLTRKILSTLEDPVDP